MAEIGRRKDAGQLLKLPAAAQISQENTLLNFLTESGQISCQHWKKV